MLTHHMLTAPEIEELRTISAKYYSLREELQGLRSQCDEVERQLNDTIAVHANTIEKHNHLTVRE